MQAWACAGVLMGCATVAPTPMLSGRLAVQVQATAQRPTQAFSAGFELRGDSAQGELRLLSPLGTTLASARWGPGQASLTTPAGTAQFADLDTLSREALGESLPLAALNDWLRGRPWPAAAFEPSAAAPGFAQLGWRLDLSGFSAGALLAQRDEAPAVTVRVRLDRDSQGNVALPLSLIPAGDGRLRPALGHP